MDFPAAIGAGLLSGLAMTAMLYMGRAVMPGQMKMNLLYLLGTMMFRQTTVVYMAGAMAHAGMSIVFALIHVSIYEAIGLDSNLAAWGLLFGLAHYMVSGMAMGMMPMMHAGVRSGVVRAPGAFALDFPPGTAMGFLVLHLLFGVLVGVLYGAFGGV
jgi:hypothetical protein